MRTASMRTRIICALMTFCLLALMAAMKGGAVHAAQLKNVEAPFSHTARPNVDPAATITGMSISFFTHNDNKDFDTSVSVLVQERVNLFLTQDLAKLSSFAGTTDFGDNPPSTHTFNLPLSSKGVKLSDLGSAPTFRITIAPNGHDRWIFDATLTLTASDGSQFSSLSPGIILDQDNSTFNGVFNP